MNATLPIFPAMPDRVWVFDGSVRRIVDGDTLVVELDAGFHMAIAATLRLWGINTPERHVPTRLQGDAARDFTAAWCDRQTAAHPERPLRVLSLNLDAFGRVLAVVYGRADGECLNSALLAAGMAVPDVRGDQP